MQVSKKHCAGHTLKSLGRERKEVVQKKKEEREQTKPGMQNTKTC